MSLLPWCSDGLFVNPDLFVRPGWIEPLLARLEAGASIVAPVLLDPDGSIQEAGARVHSDGSTSPILDRSSDNGGSSERPDYASAACWLVEREEHERLGGFDAAFYPAFYEDVDLALRALGDPDAFPSSDVVVRRALDGVSAGDALRAADGWRPHRAWATAHLWAGQTAPR